MIRVLEIPFALIAGWIIYMLGTKLLDNMITGTSVSDLMMIRLAPITIATGVVIGAIWHTLKPTGGGRQ
jgi:hypothetical protein